MRRRRDAFPGAQTAVVAPRRFEKFVTSAYTVDAYLDTHASAMPNSRVAPVDMVFQNISTAYEEKTT